MKTFSSFSSNPSIKLLKVTEFLVSSLVESGAMELAALAEAVEAVDRLGLDPTSLKPIGPQIVAKAWTDPDFKVRTQMTQATYLTPFSNFN